ncbi:unnamed protein product [Linum trigynum]|uniref:Uncharacterized protein n=1 Tax=Linum trigynum TaxID=586398 RepID=A0AAV2GEK1_9ROSI
MLVESGSILSKVKSHLEMFPQNPRVGLAHDRDEVRKGRRHRRRDLHRCRFPPSRPSPLSLPTVSTSTAVASHRRDLNRSRFSPVHSLFVRLRNPPGLVSEEYWFEGTLCLQIAR